MLGEREAIEKERELELAQRYEELEAELAELEERGRQGHRASRPASAPPRRTSQAIRERYEVELDLVEPRLRRVQGPLRPQDHRRRDAVARARRPLRRVLRGRHGRRGHQGPHRPHRPRRARRSSSASQIDPPEGQKPLSAQRKQKAIKRLKIVSAFNRRDDHGRRVNDPLAMILDVVPVIPPELRPMVQLDGGRFATSDLNDLYRRVINRNNRLKRLLDLGAPEIIVNNEKRMLQEAVDALFDNGRRGRPVTGPGNRPLKSLSDMLKGKQGRFRQNLLGKRVDYSGRSVIVVGPTLKLHQCGLPKLMALELFKPFVMKRLVDLELAQNIKSAKRMVERRRPQVWDVLEEVIKEHPVLLNRAPTLHRLGIQAFEPVLVEGKAIQIHPLVCHAFNADFDGDQMAVHLPLSAEAQAEARVLMLSANNILSPADGRPLVTPDPGHDHRRLLPHRAGRRAPRARAGSSVHLDEVERAYESRRPRAARADRVPPPRAASPASRTATAASTTDHRRPGALQHDACPRTSRSRTSASTRRSMGRIVDELADDYDKADVATQPRRASRTSASATPPSRASRSRSTTSRRPAEKTEILDRHEKEADKVENQFRRGIITDDERRQKEVEIWTDGHRRGRARPWRSALKAEKFNPIDMMVGSGARGNMMQVRQIAGMRGLVANPRGDMIPRPIKSNFREGLSMLEYFISTPGARKGLVDTALRTADSGYLTRRLVDVAQELIINDEDPFADGGPVRGIWIEDVEPDRPGQARATSRPGSSAAPWPTTSRSSDGTVFAQGHRSSTRTRWSALPRRPGRRPGSGCCRRSPTTPTSASAAACYGLSLATGKTHRGRRGGRRHRRPVDR